MKTFLMLCGLLLLCNLAQAQNDTKPLTQNSPPITTNGIKLPQLITTNLNRNDLQFGVNLSQGINNPFLSADYKKFVSDEKKQFTLSSRAFLDHTFSFNEFDNLSFYTFNNISISLNADLKIFNENDLFFQVGTQNLVNKSGGLTDFDFINTFNSINVGFGMGRIDYSTDGAAAFAIVDKLRKYGVLSKELTENEYLLLTQKINELKNRRKFVNRSYPLTEVEEIQDLLLGLGVMKEGIDALTLLEDVYRFEPMFERTVGSQISIGATGTYTHVFSDFFDFNQSSIRLNASYMVHTPLSAKLQYNRGVNAFYAVLSDDDRDDIQENETSNGIGLQNDFHYLVDLRTRLSFYSNLAYNNYSYSFVPISPSISVFNSDGFYLSTQTELEYQITRLVSATIGIALSFSPNYNYSGLNLGLNF